MTLKQKGYNIEGMNKLSTERRAQILGMMVEGNSIRAIIRMTGASKNTIVKLLEDAGEAFRPIRIARSAISPASGSNSTKFGRSATQSSAT